MDRALTMLGTLCFVGAIAFGQNGPALRQTPPPLVQECDHFGANTNCAIWTSDGTGGYTAKWDHGETGHIALGSFDGQTVQFLNQDATGKKLRSTYTGRVSGDEIVDGVITWKMLGREFKATWTGKLIYPPDSLPISQSGTSTHPSPLKVAPDASSSASPTPSVDVPGSASPTHTATTSRKPASKNTTPIFSDQDIQTAVLAARADSAKGSEAAKAQAATVPQMSAEMQAKLGAPGKAQPPRARVGGGTMSSFLIEKKAAVYPIDARAALVEGAVALYITIDKDGNVRNVRVREGLQELAASAIEAVSHYRYKPYTQQGSPVEVDTGTSVSYALSSLLADDTNSAGRDLYMPDNLQSAPSGITRTDLPPRIQACGGIIFSPCAIWSLNGSNDYSRPVYGGTTEHLSVTKFDGKTIQFTHNDFRHVQQTCEGRITKDGIAYATVTADKGYSPCREWAIDLLYPAPTSVPNFLLGSWKNPTPTLTEEPCFDGPGLPSCAVIRANRARLQASITASMPGDIVFTNTEITVPQAVGETKHFPANYTVLTERLVIVTLPYENQAAGFPCRLLSSGELYCRGGGGGLGPVPLNGLVHAK